MCQMYMVYTQYENIEVATTCCVVLHHPALCLQNKITFILTHQCIWYVNTIVTIFVVHNIFCSINSVYVAQ